MKKPQRLPLEKIYNILPEEIRKDKNRLSYRNGMGVIINIDNMLFRRLKLASSPYLIEDYRMGMIAHGSLHGIINLQEYTMREGSIVFITPGTIVEPIDVSDDFLILGMGLPADTFLLAHGGKLPQLFCGQTKGKPRVVPAHDCKILGRMFRLLHDIMGNGNMPADIIYNMVSAITHYYDMLFRDDTAQPAPSHSAYIFDRFLRLVNMHASQEHQLSFYADKLCITSRYLGTVVQATSGVGAKTWIDRAIVSAAKVLLRHSDKQTAQIADELNFANVSFFCKYFKRLTGVTPQQYRNGNG